MAHFSAPAPLRRPSRRTLAMRPRIDALATGASGALWPNRLTSQPTRGAMRYQAFQAAADLLAPARLAAGWANGALALGPPWLRDLPPLSHYSAAWEMLPRAGLTHTRPDYGIRSVTVGGETVTVTEQVVAHTA